MPSEWTREQREDAYQAYRSLAGKRSLRRTAELTSVPFGTLTEWSRLDGWVLRLQADDDRDRAIIRRHAEMRLVAEEDTLIDDLLYLAKEGGPKDKVKLEAIKHALGLLGHAAAKDYAPVQSEPHPLHTTDLRSLTDQELAALEHGSR